MTSDESTINGSFDHGGVTYSILWHDIDDKLPNLKWQQVYVVGYIDGKVPIVHYPGEYRDNLPGGAIQPGETIDEAVSREVQEELNCSVVSWVPLGYQACSTYNSEIVYQLRVAAKLKVIGPFVKDSGGAVIGHSLVPIESLNSHIGYGEIGDRLVELAVEAYKKL